MMITTSSAEASRWKFAPKPSRFWKLDSTNPTLRFSTVPERRWPANRSVPQTAVVARHTMALTLLGRQNPLATATTQLKVLAESHCISFDRRLEQAELH